MGANKLLRPGTCLETATLEASGLCALFFGVSWLQRWVRTVHSHVALALDFLPEGSFNLGVVCVLGTYLAMPACGDSGLRQDMGRGS